MGSEAANLKLELKVGDWVVVRSAEEILATLDQNARFEQLPFMPQMLQHCGMKFQVRKRAHKLCDTVFGTGGRQMADAVFLDDIRCDGQAFGGCEMKCIFSPAARRTYSISPSNFGWRNATGISRMARRFPSNVSCATTSSTPTTCDTSPLISSTRQNNATASSML